MRAFPGQTRESPPLPLRARHEFVDRPGIYLIPWDRAHSKTVGGLPLVSDTFLLQKQQTFNRSKNLERESSFLAPFRSFLLGG